MVETTHARAVAMDRTLAHVNHNVSHAALIWLNVRERKAPEQQIDEAGATELISDLFAYQGDLWQRSILFLDTLRQRANEMLAHNRAGKPPLLDFDYELIADARRFTPPANYALLRITRVGDDCLDDCLDNLMVANAITMDSTHQSNC